MFDSIGIAEFDRQLEAVEKLELGQESAGRTADNGKGSFSRSFSMSISKVIKLRCTGSFSNERS